MVSVEEYRLLMENKKPSKYGNKIVKDSEGNVFHSKRELRRWGDLLHLQAAGEIRNLRRQVRYEFPIHYVGGKSIFYVADFVYEEKVNEWSDTVEDSKGFLTAVYLIKKAMMLHFFGITILET